MSVPTTLPTILQGLDSSAACQTDLDSYHTALTNAGGNANAAAVKSAAGKISAGIEVLQQEARAAGRFTKEWIDGQ
jgi:hypothetical protein